MWLVSLCKELLKATDVAEQFFCLSPLACGPPVPQMHRVGGSIVSKVAVQDYDEASKIALNVLILAL